MQDEQVNDGLLIQFVISAARTLPRS